MRTSANPSIVDQPLRGQALACPRKIPLLQRSEQPPLMEDVLAADGEPHEAPILELYMCETNRCRARRNVVGRDYWCGS